MNEEMDGYCEQASFDNQIEGLNLFDFSEFGPNPKEFETKLKQARWKVDGMRLIRSQTNTNLNDLIPYQ